MEAKLQNSLYKLELHWIKIIPMVISVLLLSSTILSYLDIDTTTIAYIIALLVWLFLYLSSFVFKFCRWHRMFLYYIFVLYAINWYDYTFIIPLSLRPMIALQLTLAGIFLLIGLYCYKHDKRKDKRNCGKAPYRVRN